MKNQYFGDVGDYGKYAMLRFLANNGVSIAVNWYLTPDDGSNDGKHITYLDNTDDRRYDAELFDLLREMVSIGERDIIAFEKKNAILDAKYYSECLPDEAELHSDRKIKRELWHKEAMKACSGVDMVFLDPDNGAHDGAPTGTKDSVKYCYADEIADYFEAGQNVVYYCQKGRRTYEQWEETKSMMKRKLPDAMIAVITFHRGTQRSYIFVLHKENFRKYAELIKRFLREWPGVFTEEYGETGSWTGGGTGEKFTVTNSAGVEMRIEECMDGCVEIHFSDKKNCFPRIKIDELFRRLRY